MRTRDAVTPGHSLPSLPRISNHCFCCGPDNRNGMHLCFEEDTSAGIVRCRFRLTRRYEGPPGHAHGGIVAAILDEAMGKVNRLRHVIALTRRMEVEYLRPVPLRTPLLVEGSEVRVDGRKHANAAELRTLQGEVLARSTGLFIAVDAERMFKDYLPEERGPRARPSRP